MNSRLRLLVLSTLYNLIPASVLVAGLAAAISRLVHLPPGYMGQCLAIWIGLVLALSPFLPQHLPLTQFGAANRVTLARAGIAAFVAGLIGRSELTAPQSGLIVALASFALLLDGVDGWLARRLRLESRFGARFDMEVDAFFILILSVLVWENGKVGVWVLLSGLMRYGYVALGYVLPWLHQPVPPRKWRQTICVIQMLALILCLIPRLFPPWTTWLAALALGLLSLSFALDIVWLARADKRL